jgi:hypothetical protein
MKHELWVDLEKQDTFCLAGSAGDAARALLEPGTRLEWVVDADCHFDAMTKYYEYRGWGVYTTDYPEKDKEKYSQEGSSRE